MATFLITLGGLFTFWLLIVGYNVLTGPHAELGVVDGQLTPVPDSPNAVSSFAISTEHRMEPIPYSGSPEQAFGKIKDVVESMPRTNIIVAEDNYLRAEFQSGFFRFVDDVEFLVEEDMRMIQFRSASRLGHSDLGANRSRMEEFRRRFEQAPSQSMTK
ncbi:MAG: DUF1499 domain-containing protein [Fuerstiella sp.]